MKLNEEQSLILRPAGKVAVRAGAGSGKTRAIIAKYLRILEAGEADIPQVVAVTFTEAAAAELKSRISSEITRYIFTYGPRGNMTEGWRRKFFSAPIATIHGFCTKILKENIFDSKLPFSFSVIEDSDQQVFYERNIGKFLRMRMEEGDPRLGRLLEMESYNYAEIVKIIGMILKEAAKLHLIPPFVRYGGVARHEKLSVDELESIGGELRRLIREHASTLPAASKKKKLVLSDLRGKIDMTLGIDRNIRHLQAVYEQIKEERKTPEVELSRQALLRQVFSVVERYDSEISSLYLDLSGEVYDFLVDAKISEEKIEYEDMIRFTLDLLTENQEILDYYRNFLKFIIVDEFQDTDSLQLELMELLTEGDPSVNLIVVGDVNQSVYGFRGAQPEIFGDILEDENFEKISFATNYRSRRSLIEFFNLFFAGTFSEKYYEMMKASSSDPDPDISVEIIACEGKNAKESAEAEARAVASRIKELQRESSGEIALLFSRRSPNMPAYQNALTEEGIRFQSLIGRDFYDLPEVRDVMSMLRYFLDPFDVIAEAAVLRSPYFGASDDELFSHFRGENEDKNAARVREYLRFLDEKRKEYINGDTFRAIDFVVNGLGYSSAARALPGGEVKRLNLKKFLLMAEDLVSQKGYGLYQIVEHFDSLRGSQEERAFEEVDDGGVVKLMTVHKAKGLEFDMVFLCHTNYQRVVTSERVMADTEGGGFVVRYPAFSSDSWQHLKSCAEAKEAEEEKRALYVAMTRAKKGLFVCLSGNRLARKKQIRVQRDSFAELADSKLCLSSRCLEKPQGFIDETWGVSFPGLYRDEASEEPAAVSGAPPLETEIPLDLKYMEPIHRREDKPRRVELPDLFSPTDRLKDPERAGSIMHRFLEVWDFREETAEKEIEFVLGEFLVSNPNMKELLLELSSNFLSSELLSLIRAAQEVKRELKFVFDPREGAPKRGRIDLLTEEKGGVRLFDYKYRRSMNDDAREAYKEQMDGYCEAISSRFEKPLLSRHIVLIPKVELVSI